MDYLRLDNNKSKIYIIILLAILLPAIYTLVYYTGGVKYVFSHTMYIPIVLAGVLLGKFYGIGFGLVGGLLLGPLMPITIDPFEVQEIGNWLYRLLVFIIIGGLSGTFSDLLHKYINKSKKMVLYNNSTNNPNQYYLYTSLKKHETYTIISLLLSDKDDICEAFGKEVFNRIMRDVYLGLKDNLTKDTIIAQSETDVFWIACPKNLEKLEINPIYDAIENIKAFENLSIYKEIYLGIRYTATGEEIIDSELFQKIDSYAQYAKKHRVSYPVSKEDVPDIIEPKIFLLNDFRSALKNNDTFLSYQPIVNLSTLENHGYEALIRWQHPKEGVIPPNDFIPLVEKTQLVHPLLHWVLNQSTDMLNHVNEFNNNSMISINFSGNNFENPYLVQEVIDIANSNHINPENLIIEITETILIANEYQCLTMLKDLKAIGFKVAIDDYGSEYSSLNYISKFPIDFLKLDQYFISNLDNDSSYEIVKSTIELAHKLGFKIVAEGVESIEDVKRLRDLDCDFAQGYYFSKPIHQEQFAIYIQNEHTYQLKN